MRERVIVVTFSSCLLFIKRTQRQLTFSHYNGYQLEVNKKLSLFSFPVVQFSAFGAMRENFSVSGRSLIQPRPTLGPCKLT